MREKEHENDIRCYGVRKMKDIIEINGFIYEKRKEEITKKIFIKSRYDETKILFESDKKTMKEVLEDANLKGANLEDANLEGAKVLLCTVNFSKTEIKQAEQFIINLKKEANND